MRFHPLFPPPEKAEEDELPGYTEDNIDRIMVGRYDTDGKFRTALRDYQPTELRSLSDVFSAYGGGTYDLLAVNKEGRIFRRPRYILEGASKSLNGVDASQPQSQPGAPNGAPQPIAAGDPLSAMMQFMGSLITVQIQQQGALLTALVAGKNNQPPPVDPMTQVAPLINALSNFMPKQPIAAPVAAVDPIKTIRDINALQNELKPPPAEEKISEVITASVGAIAPVIGQLLTRGAPPVPALGPAG